MSEISNAKIEIYVRFETKDGLSGVHETPFGDIREAAGQFSDDHDCISAMKVAIDDRGRPVAMSDVTDKVVEALVQMIEEGLFDSCPHPLLESRFDDIMQEIEQASRDEDEHIRIERSIIHSL